VWGSATDVQQTSARLNPLVRIEEDVYSFAPANNGAFPLWNYGSTNITRVRDKVFVSGLETMVDFPPLNNTRCTMWRRDMSGWTLVMHDPSGWTREPCPLASFPKQQGVFLSTNPTLNSPGRAGGGPSKPAVLEFSALQPNPSSIEPVWLPASRPPQFTEHSYRSFAADGQHGELILIQTLGIRTPNGHLEG
jgi:hypothetical protein